jgi:hypothetical protein
LSLIYIKKTVFNLWHIYLMVCLLANFHTGLAFKWWHRNGGFASPTHPSHKHKILFGLNMDNTHTDLLLTCATNSALFRRMGWQAAISINLWIEGIILGKCQCLQKHYPQTIQTNLIDHFTSTTSVFSARSKVIGISPFKKFTCCDLFVSYNTAYQVTDQLFQKRLEEREWLMDLRF